MAHQRESLRSSRNGDRRRVLPAFVVLLASLLFGPALAIGAPDEGHLRVGARADLAILSVGLDALLGSDVDFGAVRSETTIVDGMVTG